MAEELFEVAVEFRGKRYKDAQVGLRALAMDLGKAEQNFYPVISRELKAFVENVAEALARRHGNPWPGGTTTNSLSKRSGELIKSLKENARVTGGDLDSLQATFGATFYGRIQEFGGTITPKKAKYLTIPLPEALNSDGTPKKASAREWQNTFIITSKKGNLLIVRRQGRGIVPLYVLKTSVYIPPRLNLRTTVETGLPAWVDELGDKLLKALLEA